MHLAESIVLVNITIVCNFKSLNINIFRHLKLEIAFAIPVSNDENINKQFSNKRVNHLGYKHEALTQRYINGRPALDINPTIECLAVRYNTLSKCSSMGLIADGSFLCRGTFTLA